MLKRFAPLAMFLSYIIIAIIYIHPGEIPFFTLSTTEALSDGSDPQSFPYTFQAFIDLVKEQPSDGLWGAVYFKHIGSPGGSVVWLPILERVQAFIFGSLLPIEQAATAFALLGMALNGFFMYFLGKNLRIPSTISWMMGFAFAISAYTRARAKVHMGLVGIYHLPLVFLGLFWLFRNNRRSQILSSLAFLLISFFPQYYVVTISLFAPLLAFTYFKLNPNKNLSRSLKQLLISLIPAALWLSFSVIFPVPPSTHQTTQVFPQTGKTTGEYHPFLDTYSLRPVDLFTGDIANGTKDLNPIKETIAIAIKKEKYDGSNSHERSNGVRWILWVTFFAALIWLMPSQKKFWRDSDRTLCFIFLVFGLVSFWLALPPNWPIPGLGGSLLVHKLISQIRVPNRAAIGVAFAVILISGLFFKNLLLNERFRKRGKWLAAAWGFLIVLELPPFYQNLPIAVIDPPIQTLSKMTNCGRGFQYPYVSGGHNSLFYYHFLQQMRSATHCETINQNAGGDLDYKLAKYFSNSFSLNLNQNMLDKQSHLIKDFALCAGASWVFMGFPLKPEYAKALCDQMQWQWSTDRSCLRPDKPSALPATIDHCLNIL